MKALHFKVDFSDWDHRGCHSKSCYECSFNLAIKYLSINFHNNMYMNKTFHLPSYICMCCFNPLSRRSYFFLAEYVYAAYTYLSRNENDDDDNSDYERDDMIKGSWAYCLLSFIHVFTLYMRITRPFKVIFLCRTANFYRAKDDGGIINQKIPRAKKLWNFIKTKESFWKWKICSTSSAYMREKTWRYEKVYLKAKWMTASLHAYECVWNSLKISAY